MTYATPEWHWLLLMIPLLLLMKWWSDRRAHHLVLEVVAPRLRSALVRGTSRGRSWLTFCLQLLALALLVNALARPRWGEEKREIQETGRNVIIAIDTSRSMLATDVTPDRLTRAKLAAQDLIATLPGDRVGLLAFAGQAYLQAPLTTDHAAVIETIQSLDHTSVPRGGSDLTKALRLAMETFEKTPARNHGMIIFSDGGEPEPELAAFARQAAEKRVMILTVGVGTEAGSLIPNPDGGVFGNQFGGPGAGDFVRDREGNVVQTRLETSVLQQLASATGGRFLKLSSTPLSRGVVDGLLSSLDRQQAASREETKPIERFYWPLSLGMFMLMIAWLIRPTTARPVAAQALALLMLGVPMPAPAQDIPIIGTITGGDQPKPSEAPRAYGAGLFEQARDLYARFLGEKKQVASRNELAYGLGASAHKLTDYDRAVSGFSDALESDDPALQRRAHRGLGHALYDQGDKALAKQPQFTLNAWTDSIRHFEAALKFDADDKEVRENLDFVKKRLKELQQQQQEQQQQQQQKKKKEGGKDKKKGESKGSGQKGDESQEGEGEEGEQAEQGDQPNGKKGKSQQEQEEGEDGENGQNQNQGQNGEQKDEQEGKGGQMPEGNLQAGGEGKPDQNQQKSEEMPEADRNETTGFSRNEARAFLRTYADDQKQVQFRQQRKEPANGKDW
jgi:Ca-activated chloride channel family protein